VSEENTKDWELVREKNAKENSESL